jgi:mono/diheme cytochrome c family protein
MSLRPLPSPAFVAGLLLVAVGCGGNSNGTEDGSPSPPAEMAPRPERPPPRSFAPPSDPTPPRPEPPSEAELSAARRARYVEAVQSVDTLLERNCGACHGKSVPTSPCGLRFDNTDDLYVLALIAPLSADASRVVQVIVDGSMPPAGVQPRPTSSELDQLRAFIEGDASFWSRPGGDDRTDRAYSDALSNACDAPREPGFDAGVSDAGIASP